VYDKRQPNQPAALAHPVWVNRFDADKKLLAVMFVQVRNLASESPTLDLGAACVRLGWEVQRETRRQDR
jgi:hypothetical protein